MDQDFGAKKTVLFICNHNSARSQMAEAFMNRMHGEKFVACSAGVMPAAVVNPLAVKVMSELEIDISQNRPKNFDGFAGQRFDYVISVCDAVAEKCPVVIGDTVARNMGIPDPSALAAATDDPNVQIAEFRRAREALRLIVGNVVLFAEREIRQDLTKQQKRELSQKHYAEHIRAALDMLIGDLGKLPHPEGVVCMLENQLKNVLLCKLPKLRNQQLWPLVSLVVAMLAASTRGDFTDLIFPGSGPYWKLAFLFGLAGSVWALIYTFVKTRKQKDPQEWTEELVQDIKYTLTPP